MALRTHRRLDSHRSGRRPPAVPQAGGPAVVQRVDAKRAAWNGSPDRFESQRRNVSRIADDGEDTLRGIGRDDAPAVQDAAPGGDADARVSPTERATDRW